MNERICAWQREDSSEDEMMTGPVDRGSIRFESMVSIKPRRSESLNMNTSQVRLNREIVPETNHSYVRPTIQKHTFQKLMNTSMMAELKPKYSSLPITDYLKRDKHKIKLTDFYQKPMTHVTPLLDHNSSQIFSNKQYNRQSNILRLKKQYLQLRLQNVSFQNDERYINHRDKYFMELSTKAEPVKNTARKVNKHKLLIDPTYNQKSVKERDLKFPSLAQISTSINKKLSNQLARARINA